MLHGVFYPCAMGSDTVNLFFELSVLSGVISDRNSSIRQYEMGRYAYTGFSGSGRDSQLFCGQFSFFSNRALGSVFASHGSKRRQIIIRWMFPGGCILYLWDFCGSRSSEKRCGFPLEM